VAWREVVDVRRGERRGWRINPRRAWPHANVAASMPIAGPPAVAGWLLQTVGPSLADTVEACLSAVYLARTAWAYFGFSNPRPSGAIHCPTPPPGRRRIGGSGGG
jgi:hypothetical protein